MFGTALGQCLGQLTGLSLAFSVAALKRPSLFDLPRSPLMFVICISHKTAVIQRLLIPEGVWFFP